MPEVCNLCAVPPALKWEQNFYYKALTPPGFMKSLNSMTLCVRICWRTRAACVL